MRSPDRECALSRQAVRSDDMTDLGNVERKLDLLIALTRIGLSDALARERQKINSDPVFTAVLRAAAEPIAPGLLKDRVRAETCQSKATVERRIAELVARGALVRESGNGGAAYRSTGLLDG